MSNTFYQGGRKIFYGGGPLIAGLSLLCNWFSC